MTDLTPEQSEAVRRLLAEARTDEPMPPEVAARLDAVLAGLAGNRGDDAPLAPVVAIRRRWPAALLAAAAVTVVAVGATQVLGPQGAGQDAGISADERSIGGGDGSAEDQELAPPPAANAPSPTSDSPREPTELGYAADQDRLVEGLSQLVDSGARVLDGPWLDAYVPGLTPITDTRGAITGKDLSKNEQPTDRFPGTTGSVDRLSGTSCGPLDPFPLYRTYAAVYRGHPALVVVLPPIDGSHTVQVFDCQSASPRLAVETATVPVGQLPPGE